MNFGGSGSTPRETNQSHQLASRRAPPPSRSARTKRGDARRALVLKVAAKLLAERGYSEVSINEIGMAAGISGPGIYRYFASKQELLIAIYEDLCERDREGVEAIRNADHEPEDFVRALISHQLHLATSEWEKIRIFSSEARHLPGEFLGLLRAENRTSLATWRNQLCRARPELTGEQADVTVHAGLALINSLSLRRSPHASPPAVLEQVERLAVNALLGGGEVDEPANS